MLKDFQIKGHSIDYPLTFLFKNSATRPLASHLKWQSANRASFIHCQSRPRNPASRHPHTDKKHTQEASVIRVLIDCWGMREGLQFLCTIASKINVTLKGVHLPIFKLHSILAVANLLAHYNKSQICYRSQISLQSAS